MSTRECVLSPQDTDDDTPEARYSIDEEAYRSDRVELMLRHGDDCERFRVTDEDEAIYEETGFVPTWCEGTIRWLASRRDLAMSRMLATQNQNNTSASSANVPPNTGIRNAGGIRLACSPYIRFFDFLQTGFRNPPSGTPADPLVVDQPVIGQVVQSQLHP